MASSVINEDGTVTNTSVPQSTTPQVADSVCGKAAAAQVEAAIATTPIEG